MLALAAIVAPAAIVAVLGYVSLRQWERSADMLFREQARDVAAMAVEKVEMQLRHAEDGFLDALQARLSAGAPDRALDELVADSRLVRVLRLFDRNSRLLYASGPAAAAAAGRAARELPREFWERGGRREVLAGDEALQAALLTRRGAPVLAIFARNVEALRRDIFETTLGALESPTIIAVLDHAGRPVYSRQPLEGAEPVLSVEFREGLPSWRVAVYAMPGASPREAARRQVMIFSGAFCVLLLVIVGGSVFTLRLVRRESEMAQLKADFVANVSHDLKTPLSLIRMFGETLEMGRVPDDARRQEYYRVITRESERLSRLIDNVLDFSRIERGRRTYDLVPTAVEPLVRETLEAFAYTLAQQGFKVETRIAPDLPEAPLDAEAVAQALANLIDNAIKYSGERRSIVVEAARDGERLAISVADEGVGIPAEEQARIFEKFYRVGRSETQGRRGSGVGLALVRHVAQAHGGSVTVDSRPGAGSRFTLRLPLARHG